MKKSANIIEKNFFFLDSNSLDTVQTHLYGYCITNDVDGQELSIENVEFPRAYSNGAYVLLQSIGDKLYISQDYSGSCGIYLFRRGDYFALSNSFLLMFEKLDARFPLTFNYDYANAYIGADLCSLAYSETMVNEIEMLPRDVQIIINKKNKTIHIADICYQEHSVEIDTVEALQILDEWYEKWTCIIHVVKSMTDNIMCDLSGGFDSRMTFGLFTRAGIDLNKVYLRSRQDDLRIHGKDYSIASQIAEHYSTFLNKGNLSKESFKLGFEDIINISFYANFGTSKHMFWRADYWDEPLFRFTGCGGECIRAFYPVGPQLYIENECRLGKRYKSVEVTKSISRIMDNIYRKVTAKFPFVDEQSIELTRIMYRETRNRNHFGKHGTELYCTHEVLINPLLDVKLGRICSPNNEYADLLMALIFIRYYPELLEFPHADGKELDRKTLERAREINEMVPFQSTKEKTLTPTKSIFYFGDNKIIDGQKYETNISEVDKFVYDVFKSDRVHKMTTACFHEDIYEFADNYMNASAFFPLMGMKEIYPIINSYLAQNMLNDRVRMQQRTIIERMKDTIASGPINPNLCLKEVNHDKKNYTFLFPFEMIPQNANIILYGAGNVGQAFYKQIEKSGYCKISAWVDRDYMKLRGGVQPPDIIEDNGMFDYVVIAIVNAKIAEQIRDYLLDKGVSKEKIVWRAPEFEI